MTAFRQQTPRAGHDGMTNPCVDERELVTRTMGGDHAAFTEIYAVHASSVYAAAHRLLGNATDAEDVTQELFIALPQTLAGYDPTRGPLGPWLRRVAVRLALMRMRGTRRRRETSAEGVVSLLARDDHPLDRLSIAAALERVSEDQRTVFLLKEVEGYEHSEIAALLDISVSNSEIRLFRARKALRALLGDSR